MDKEITDKYIITKNGDVINKKTMKPLKPQMQKNGYYNVTFSINGVKKTYNIHRLVAILYLRNENNFRCINQKDGNKLNNHMSNLEWCTYAYNTKHAYSHGLRSKYNKKNSKNSSGHVGVIFDKSSNKWIARLHKNRSAIYLGSFNNKEDAIKKRKEAEKEVDKYK